mmetsp:Transcript_3238/g.3708  ORF Transcript_3238/g.3708 Transcript_3238/m.3708 type:complete len:832 (-) Transcript_3238:142-2637(-)
MKSWTVVLSIFLAAPSLALSLQQHDSFDKQQQYRGHGNDGYEIDNNKDYRIQRLEQIFDKEKSQGIKNRQQQQQQQQGDSSTSNGNINTGIIAASIMSAHNRNMKNRGNPRGLNNNQDDVEDDDDYLDDGYGYAAADDGNDEADDYTDSFNADELCAEYLVSFMAGTTDTKDQCDAVSNAYVAAYCTSAVTNEYDDHDDDHDDYFVTYNHVSCCEALKGHFDAYCTESELITNMHLLLIASVLLLCEMAKSLIKTHKIHWLPEAGGCMLVGTLCGALAHFLPWMDLDDLSFDENLFLCILLPPIIFEAALSVNKKEFRRRRLAILMFAVIGTILSTFTTGYIVHYTSSYLSSATTIPLLDSFIFGALISSIDPVAILSVLTSLNLTERDTIYIMVLGESLLNDGIAITLFKTLVAHYDGGAVDTDEILGTIADFVIVGFGSILIGLICGFVSLIYFWLLKKKLTPPMEVASFFLWAGIPYYICDEVNLSGIVAIVTVGFFMDIYIAKPKHAYLPIADVANSSSDVSKVPFGRNSFVFPFQGSSSLHQNALDSNSNYVDLGDSDPCNPDNFCGPSPSGRSIYSLRSLKSLRTLNMRELLLREERFRLSAEADRHIRFVAHLLSSLSENCIFVYLGLFLFSKQYEWDVALCVISCISCVLSRAIMIPIVCLLIWHINIIRQWSGCYKPAHLTSEELESGEPQVSRTAASLQEPKIQLVLVLAGLRGAVSLALVESVPIYNAVTGEGCIYKGEMKAMTSCAIIFTIFVIGGSSYYVLRNLNISSETGNSDVSVTPPARTRKNQTRIKEAPRPEDPMIRKPSSSSSTNGDLPSLT